MKRQENRTVIAWREAASADLVSLADRAYMEKFLFGRNHLKIMLPTTD